MLILFLGPDTSGKDSLMHAVSKLFDYSYYMSPRSPICNIVYDEIYQRSTPERKRSWLNIINEFLKLDCYFAYVKVDPEILEQRAKARNEKHVSSLSDFKKHISVYERVINECKKEFPEYTKRFVEIENSKDLNEVASDLVKKITSIMEKDCD